MSNDLVCAIKSRQLLIHAHMFKNAGTTFDNSLQGSFGDGFIDHRDDDDMRKGADYLGPYLQEHTEIQALSSHWITFPLPKVQDLDFHLALIFRDPLERILSVYRFEKRQPTDSPGVLKARELEFPDYVRWRLSDNVGPVIRNFHTRYCSGRYMDEDLDSMYELALQTLESTPLIGLVNRYDESMVLFEYHLAQYFPQLDLSSTHLNTSDEIWRSAEEKKALALRELEPVMDEVLDANQYDLKMYRQVEERFERSLEKVPDFSRRLDAFRARSEAC